MVEQWPFKPLVAGSSPAALTNRSNPNWVFFYPKFRARGSIAAQSPFKPFLQVTGFIPMMKFDPCRTHNPEVWGGDFILNLPYVPKMPITWMVK
jgi:hypothetical protein